MGLIVHNTFILDIYYPGEQACGVIPDKFRLTNHVVGGSEAKEGELPWMAHLKLRNPDTNYTDICGGVILSTRNLLTAGHCFDNG